MDPQAYMHLVAGQQMQRAAAPFFMGGSSSAGNPFTGFAGSSSSTNPMAWFARPPSSPWGVPGFSGPATFGPHGGAPWPAYAAPLGATGSVGDVGDDAGGSGAAPGTARTSLGRGARRGLAGDIFCSPSATTVGKPVAHKADWNDEATAFFCRAYCEQLDKGNCVGTRLTKVGWAQMCQQFQEEANIVHTTQQLSSFYTNLKAVWRFCNYLHYEATGVGRENGVVQADDWWWEQTLKGKNKKWIKFRSGYPSYLEQMDRMYSAEVDSSSSYVAPRADPNTPRTPIAVPSSDDDDEAQLDTNPTGTPVASTSSKRPSSTPQSYPSKKANSTASTGHSPSKKSHSPILNETLHSLRNLQGVMSSTTEYHTRRLDLVHELAQKRERRSEQANQIMRQLGITHVTDPVLYTGFLNTLKCDMHLLQFFGSHDPRGMAFHFRA